MPPDTYSDDQKKDITSRINKANELLKNLNLTVACLPTWEMTNGTYCLKLHQYLQDTKYNSVPSPLSP